MYAAGDRNTGRNPNVTGSAYINSDNDPATATTLYAIDFGLDVLATQNPPNAGTLNTVGALGVNTSQYVGFDVETKGTVNTAYASLTPSGSSASKLYRINLATGAATSLGTVGGSGGGYSYYGGYYNGGGKVLRDVAVVPPSSSGGYSGGGYGSGGGSGGYGGDSGTYDRDRDSYDRRWY